MRRLGAPLEALWRALVATTLVAACAGGANGESTRFGEDAEGADGPLVRVTSLAEDGPGTLAEALSGGDRRIVFDVAGEIRLSRRYLDVGGARVTIDGTSAAPPGITLRGGGLRMSGAEVHDVVVRGIRVRQPEEDGIQVAHGAHRIWIDQVSVDGCGDGNVDVTHGAYDVTVSWSILSRCAKNVLIKYEAHRVSFHHNAFLRSRFRNPWVAHRDDGASAPETTADVRSNLVWDWEDGGTGVECGARANLVGNYYASPNASFRGRSRAVIVRGGCGSGSPARLFTSGNVRGDDASSSLDALGTQDRPFPAPHRDTPSACESAHAILGRAGTRPLDVLDGASLAGVTLPECSPGSPS